MSDNVLAGALSGVFTRFLGSPLDLLKVRLQLQIEPTSTLQVFTCVVVGACCAHEFGFKFDEGNDLLN